MRVVMRRDSGPGTRDSGPRLSSFDRPSPPGQEVLKPLALVALELDGAFGGLSSGSAGLLQFPGQPGKEFRVFRKAVDHGDLLSRAGVLHEQTHGDLRGNGLPDGDRVRTMAVLRGPSAFRADPAPGGGVDDAVLHFFFRCLSRKSAAAWYAASQW